MRTLHMLYMMRTQNKRHHEVPFVFVWVRLEIVGIGAHNRLRRRAGTRIRCSLLAAAFPRCAAAIADKECTRIGIHINEIIDCFSKFS